MTFETDTLFSSYQRHSTINEYLDYLGEKYPKSVTVTNVGHSYEQRPIKCIHITNRAGNDLGTPKHTVFIDAGMHAREWISISVALYCIYQLVELYENHQALLEHLDFVILPVVNPDGYEYTHEKNRLWRKTRRPLASGWIGVDCNRNFPYRWEKAPKQPANYTYRGERPFSENETQIVRDIMNSLKTNCKFYLNLHSHSQALIYPFGCTKTLPDSWKDLHKLAQIGSNAIKTKTGRFYRYGSIASVMRGTPSGGSADYAFAIAKIPLVITMELTSGGKTGFDPHPNDIQRIVDESWIGIQAMAVHVANKFQE